MGFFVPGLLFIHIDSLKKRILALPVLHEGRVQVVERYPS